jgi:hypothetical protein
LAQRALQSPSQVADSHRNTENVVGFNLFPELNRYKPAESAALFQPRSVFHATGKRVRDLPITLDKLM